MKFLGVDYGTKRIGVATSDDEGTLAFPKIILENNEKIFEALGDIIREENVEEIVVGESTDFKGKPNHILEETTEFTHELKRFNLPIHMQKEFLTSVEARRYKTTNGKVDSSAAALILQRYLDKINNDKHRRF